MNVTEADREKAKYIYRAMCTDHRNADKFPSMEDVAINHISVALADQREELTKITGETSDGYHTFNELYDHRCLLWINLCLKNREQCYWRDGFDGWPLLGMKWETLQLSYHVPQKFLELFKDKIEKGGPEWNGHTSKDVLELLKNMALLG